MGWLRQTAAFERSCVHLGRTVKELFDYLDRLSMRLRVVGDSDSALDAWFACVGEQLFGLAIHHATG